jgi:hypothetical protein
MHGLSCMVMTVWRGGFHSAVYPICDESRAASQRSPKTERIHHIGGSGSSRGFANKVALIISIIPAWLPYQY